MSAGTFREQFTRPCRTELALYPFLSVSYELSTADDMTQLRRQPLRKSEKSGYAVMALKRTNPGVAPGLVSDR